MKPKNSLLSFLITITLWVFVQCNSLAFAIENPLDNPNNKVGIHILNDEDVISAAELVNTNGDWGYVTLVIRSDEKNRERWQKFFDNTRKLHLIPIVRIASKQQKDIWEKFKKEDIEEWVSFLNSLNWVVKNRYVVVGNEPNHAKEWGGELNPEEYAEFLEEFAKKLKSASEDFFIIQAGLDASAPNDNKMHMDEAIFIKRMLNHRPKIFDYIDGWASHSYPNPNFSGSEYEIGRGSLKTYEWEINYLKSLGVKKDLPIFITETGWAHNGEDKSKGYFSEEIVAKKLKRAFEKVWNNKKIVAITPFVLNYQDPPFNIFSWKKKEGTFYSFFDVIKNLEKVEGKPTQIISCEIISFILPPIIKMENSNHFYGLLYVKNTGQSIWEENEELEIFYGKNVLKLRPYSIFKTISPGEKTLAIYKLKI